MRALESFVEGLPRALEAAGKNPLAVAALVVFFLFLLLYAVWQDSPRPMKNVILTVIVASAVLFLISMISVLTAGERDARGGRPAPASHLDRSGTGVRQARHEAFAERTRIPFMPGPSKHEPAEGRGGR